jgi:hypothetical protein
MAGLNWIGGAWLRVPSAWTVFAFNGKLYRRTKIGTWR